MLKSPDLEVDSPGFKPRPGHFTNCVTPGKFCKLSELGFLIPYHSLRKVVGKSHEIMHVKHSAQSVVHKEPQEMAAVVTSLALSPVHRPLYSCLHISLVFRGPVYLFIIIIILFERKQTLLPSN